MMEKKRAQNNRKSNFILRTCSEEDDLMMLEPFISGSRQGVMEWMAEKMYLNRKKATKYEIIVAKYLWLQRVKYITQAPFKIMLNGFENHYYFADFYIPSLKVIIELDGFRHRTEEGIKKDEERDLAFKSIGIETIRIPNTLVYKQEYKKLIPIPKEEFLRPAKVRYVPEGETAKDRERKISKVKSLLRY